MNAAGTTDGRRPVVTVAIVVVALAVATLVEWATGASVPGRMPLFALGASIVLVLGAKQLGRVVSRPVGARVGELGDPADDVAPAYDQVHDAEVGDA